MTRVAVAAVWIMLMVVAISLGRRDPTRESSAVPTGGELRAALDQLRPLDRAAELSRYLEALSSANVDETAQIIERNHRFFTQPEHLLLMTAWTRFDPEGALHWARTREGRLQKRATIAVVEAIASADPEWAAELVEELEEVAFAGLLRDHLIRGWIRSDQLGALTQHITGLRHSDHQQAAAAILATELLQQGPDSLIRWAESIPEDAPDTFKQIAFRETVTALAVLDPAQAAAWSQDYLDEDYGKGMVEHIARRWAARSWEPTFDWLISLPQSDEQKRSLKTLFGESLKRRPDRAEAWARASAPNEALDPAIRVIIQRDYWKRPAAAMDWARLISDDDIRSEVQVGIGRSWYSQEQQEFRDWAADSGLEQDVLGQIYAPF